MRIRFIKPSQTHALRQLVLYPGRAMEDCAYPQDGMAAGFHLGVFVKDEVVAIGSFFPEKYEALKGWKQFRLRGMAVRGDHRKHGAGRRILGFAIEHLRAQQCDLLWCNAREAAFEFYTRMGFTKHGELFDIPGIGAHSVMYKRI